MTQREQVLELFLEKGDVRIYELNAPWPTGLGVSQYGRVIGELRDAGHKIVNVTPGHFRLIREPEQLDILQNLQGAV